MNAAKIFGFLVFGAIAGAGHALEPATPKACDECNAWNEPREPFRVFGNTYFVGTKGLSSILITTDQGLILIDGGLQQSASRIEENIRKLGFNTKDIRLILNSHTHFDHAGGLAELQRASGAQVAASPLSAEPLKTGKPDAADPQFGYAPDNYFPPVKNVRVIKDGETLQVGKQAITAHFTPGHTPGGTSWSWRSCEKERCLDVVYADSLTPVAAPGYRYSDEKAHPGVADAFRGSVKKMMQLPCDILLTAHPDASFMDQKLESKEPGDKDGRLINPTGGACRVFAWQAGVKLASYLAQESGVKPGPAKSELLKLKPVKSEAGDSESVKVPANSESAKAEPASSEPAKKP